MKIKEISLTALLLGIGLVLHQVTVGLLAGMKPDFVITMLFVALLLLRNNRLIIPAGLTAGIMAALTTTMPGGQLPNVIDKLVTAVFTMALIKILDKHVGDRLLTPVVGLLGTVVSGTVFLGSAHIIIGLPVSFMALFITVVLPTAAINAVLTPLIYSVALKPAHFAGVTVGQRSGAVTEKK